MKGCGRLDPFSVITYHLGLFFSPFSLAASSERMGTLEGEASSELNIDESWCVILVLIRAATEGQPVGWLADCSTHAGLHFFQCSTHTNTFLRRKKKGASSDVCSYNTVWRLFSSVPHAARRFVVWPVPMAIYGLCQSEQTSVKPVDSGTEGIAAGSVQLWIMVTAELWTMREIL